MKNKNDIWIIMNKTFLLCCVTERYRLCRQVSDYLLFFRVNSPLVLNELQVVAELLVDSLYVIKRQFLRVLVRFLCGLWIAEFGWLLILVYIYAQVLPLYRSLSRLVGFHNPRLWRFVRLLFPFPR